MAVSPGKALNSTEAHIERLRSDIAQLEARYDDSFPPSVYSALERLRGELAEFNRAR
jgi:hypothetical protein